MPQIRMFERMFVSKVGKFILPTFVPETNVSQRMPLAAFVNEIPRGILEPLHKISYD